MKVLNLKHMKREVFSVVREMNRQKHVLTVTVQHHPTCQFVSGDRIHHLTEGSYKQFIKVEWLSVIRHTQVDLKVQSVNYGVLKGGGVHINEKRRRDCERQSFLFDTKDKKKQLHCRQKT